MPYHRSLPHRAPAWRLAALLLLAFSLLLLTHRTANAQTQTPQSGTVSVVRLNVRSTPSMAGSILGKLDQNEPVTIIGVSADGDWLQVQADDVAEGWVFADYVATGGESADAAAESTTSSTPEATPESTAEATAGAAAATDASGSPTAQMMTAEKTAV